MKRITIIGGDGRLRTVRERLAKRGFAVETFGLFDHDNGDYKSSDVVLLPVPTTKDGYTVNCPLTGREIYLKTLADEINGKSLILCCNYSFTGKNCIDYGALDGYALLNAVPTAEGALKIAMENTPFTLWQSRVLVIGYGRVGKVLCDRLCAMGCRLTVSARKFSDFAMLDTRNIPHVDTGCLNDIDFDYDIIFNTVDVNVMSDETLKKCRGTLIIDLSSKGCFDLNTAKKLGINSISAPGLPAVAAPQTAAEILSETVISIIEQHI